MRNIFTKLSLSIVALTFAIAANSQPIKFWEKAVNGSGNGTDVFVSVAVDGAGNSYYTGYSSEAGNGYDYLTVKYNPKGYEVWRATYNGSASGTDQAIKVLILGSSVYVTGTSAGTATGKDIVTIKYDALTGDTVWTRRFNAPANGDDRAADMGIDYTNGYIYVVGISYNLFDPANNNTDDGVLLKYDAAGNILWINGSFSTYNNDIIKSMAVSQTGKVYVPIESVGGISTIYVFNSDTSTAKVCSIFGISEASVPSIVVDGSDNLYCIGNTGISTTIYSLANNYNVILNWQPNFPGTGIKLALDNSGNVYVLQHDSTLNQPVTTYFVRVLANADGSVLLNAVPYNPTTGLSIATDLAVNNNLLYVTGYGPSTGEQDIHTVGFDIGTGAFQWQLDEACGNSKNQSVNVLALDNFFNIYLAGKGGCNSNYDAVAIKYCNAYPAKPTITVNEQPGQTILTSSANQYNQWWMNGDSVQNANVNLFHVTDSAMFGYYQVEVSYAGCSTLSDSILIDVLLPHTTGISKLNLISTAVAPNPSSNGQFNLQIEISPSVVQMQIRIFDMMGNLINEIPIAHPANANSIEINLGNVAKGVYILQIKAGNEMENRRIIIE